MPLKDFYTTPDGTVYAREHEIQCPVRATASHVPSLFKLAQDALPPFLQARPATKAWRRAVDYSCIEERHRVWLRSRKPDV